MVHVKTLNVKQFNLMKIEIKILYHMQNFCTKIDITHIMRSQHMFVCSHFLVYFLFLTLLVYLDTSN